MHSIAPVGVRHNQSSLRDSQFSAALCPAINRWATINWPSGPKLKTVVLKKARGYISLTRRLKPRRTFGPTTPCADPAALLSDLRMLIGANSTAPVDHGL